MKLINYYLTDFNMEIPSNKEIYDMVRKKAAHINTQEQIALDAMFELRKLLEKNKRPKDKAECATCEGRDFR